MYYQAARKEYTTGTFILHSLEWYACLAALLFMALLVIAAFTGKTRITLS